MQRKRLCLFYTFSRFSICAFYVLQTFFPHVPQEMRHAMMPSGCKRHSWRSWWLHWWLCQRWLSLSQFRDHSSWFRHTVLSSFQTECAFFSCWLYSSHVHDCPRAGDSLWMFHKGDWAVAPPWTSSFLIRYLKKTRDELFIFKQLVRGV